MRTVVIDGVECQVLSNRPSPISAGVMIMSYVPLPKPKQTLVEIAAERMESHPEHYRKCNPFMAALLDAIEARLKVLEEK